MLLLLNSYCQDCKESELKSMLNRYVRLVSLRYLTMKQDAFGLTPMNNDECDFIIDGQTKWLHPQESLLEGEDKKIIEVTREFLLEASPHMS